MNEQIGGTTGAYMQQTFPYFTINIRDPDLEAGNRGGAQAFFSRLDILESLLPALDEHEVRVTGDCGLIVFPGSTLTAEGLIRLLDERCLERYGKSLTVWMKVGDDEIA